MSGRVGRKTFPGLIFRATRRRSPPTGRSQGATRRLQPSAVPPKPRPAGTRRRPRSRGPQNCPATDRPAPCADGATPRPTVAPAPGFDLGATKNTIAPAPAAAAPVSSEMVEAVARSRAECICDSPLGLLSRFEPVHEAVASSYAAFAIRPVITPATIPATLHRRSSRRRLVGFGLAARYLDEIRMGGVLRR